MRLTKPKFWDTKNFISFILYPLSSITYLINITKKPINYVIPSVEMAKPKTQSNNKGGLFTQEEKEILSKFIAALNKQNYQEAFSYLVKTGIVLCNGSIIIPSGFLVTTHNLAISS